MKKTDPTFRFCGFTSLSGLLEITSKTGCSRKQLGRNAFFLILLFSYIAIPGALAQAQKSLYIGTVEEVAATFNAKVQAKQRNAKGSDYQVQYKPEGEPPLVLTLRSSKKEVAATFYYGEVQEAENSSFYLKLSGKEVSGVVVMLKSKKYYEFSSTLAGLVYLTKQDIDKKLCVNFDPALQANRNVRNSTLEQAVPALESLPGATAVVLLDFDGQTISNTIWNSQFNSGNPIVAAPAQLTSAEILDAWKLISEDYRPFALNVTTSEAVFNKAPANMRLRAVFTPTNYFFQNAGGVAFVGSFTWGGTSYGETPVFIFNTTPKYAGEAGAHEIGHALNLLHDGRTNPTEEYYEGHANWSPIMGVGYYRNVVQWSKGEYPNANQLEDDLHIITTQNGFGYRPDDHGNTSGAATPIVIDGSGSIAANANKGLIATRADVDVFSINLSGGAVTLHVEPEQLHANLDVVLTLKNAANVTVAQADPGTMGASITGTFPAGTYYLHIDGAPGAHGANSDYGSLGSYFISGSVSVSPQFSLNIRVNGSGSVSKSPNQTFYASGSTVTLTANPASGYQFSGWSGDATGTTNPLTVTMNGNKKITATFTAISTTGVTSFNLINATTDQPIQQLVSGAVLNLATLPTRKLNIQAVTNPSTVGSVVFNLSGQQTKTRSDDSGPHYSLQGDKNGDYSSWTPAVGIYVLTARSYSGKNGSGSPGGQQTIFFMVIDQPNSSSRMAATDPASESLWEEQVKVSPNPFKDAFTLELPAGIEAEKASIALSTLTGKTVYQTEVKVNGSRQTVVLDQLSDLPSGMYLLRLQFNEKPLVLKVIKQ